VRFGVGGLLDSAAPAVRVTSDTAAVPVLGLLPSTAYRLRAEAEGRCGGSDGQDLALTTGVLPADLPAYQAGGPDPSPGFVTIGASPYGVVIDNTGRVVWYHRFPDGSGLNFQAQPNGHYVARPPSVPGEPGRAVEIDPLGRTVRTLDCARGLPTRFHDLRIDAEDASYWILCDETRSMDLSLLGGVANAQVTGTVVQHVSAAGTLLFEWNPFDHFALTDLPANERDDQSVNWTHGNSLDFDADGALLVSFRNLNEITKIDPATGRVIWRLGGLANQFAWDGAPQPFLAQHGLRVSGEHQVLVLDNLGLTGASRAALLAYDEATMTVRLVQAYAAAGVVAQLGGSTQSLQGGRVLVAFGNGGRVAEYDSAGTEVWRIHGDAGYVYRAQRIRSLYTPGGGDPR
jgi:outer membrane protein assembly factor BamB